MLNKIRESKIIKGFSITAILSGILTFVFHTTAGNVSNRLVDDLWERIFSSPANIQGLWDGNFNENGNEIISVIRIEKIPGGEEFNGSMIENRGSISKPKKINSTIDGKLSGKNVSFNKKYVDFTTNINNIFYTGTLNDDKTIIEGEWRSKLGSGKFKFRKN